VAGRVLDPVDVMGLHGELVQAIPCPYMLRDGSRWGIPRGHPCGQQALLFRYPDPYGYRSRCEDGHVMVLALTQVPGLYQSQVLKGETD
jgi:hypothetical protein